LTGKKGTRKLGRKERNRKNQRKTEINQKKATENNLHKGSSWRNEENEANKIPKAKSEHEFSTKLMVQSGEKPNMRAHAMKRKENARFNQDVKENRTTQQAWSNKRVIERARESTQIHKELMALLYTEGEGKDV